ncbi:GNAT family N-acetyltransferase [Algicella marina]|uniref:L-ornithine N(alpha)-acyltransferase n=1 Tax=Algicella marina TaxID=2683284 RepID=A0A6P1T459_9RHOB|nr:GNAT family N-acyltransferase [Algicella marina]QHQ35322.1 GNAT family N-acetyltransferase [Algicella marina]
MEYDSSRFSVRLAETETELRAAQRLRYRVFVEEMGAKAAEADHAARLERDSYDDIFDHLILSDRQIEDPLDRVVGAYRLLPDVRARETRGFYGAGEFDLSPILALGRRSVELGRSCVAPEHRGGVAMHLLWNALAEYVLSREIEIMFGVASFHGTDASAIAPALSLLHTKHLAPPDLRVRALTENAIPMDVLPESEIDARMAMRQIPNLIKAYLRLGGFVGEGAFVDHDFNTIDVCLLMDTTRMTSRYRDYYTRNAG